MLNYFLIEVKENKDATLFQSVDIRKVQERMRERYLAVCCGVSLPGPVSAFTFGRQEKAENEYGSFFTDRMARYIDPSDSKEQVDWRILVSFDDVLNLDGTD